MASEQEQVSSLPLPPVQYITLFSDENVRRGRVPKPPPIIQDNYTMFGRTFCADDTIIRPLENQVNLIPFLVTSLLTLLMSQ